MMTEKKVNIPHRFYNFYKNLISTKAVIHFHLTVCFGSFEQYTHHTNPQVVRYRKKIEETPVQSPTLQIRV